MVKIKKKTIPDNNFLTNYYYNANNVGSFSGLSSLYRVIKQKFPKIKKADLTKWAKTQKTYTRHYPRRKKIKKNQTLVGGINDTWQMDLCDMRSLKYENDNYQYILTIIDVFSKKAYAIPLKNKTGNSVFIALKNVLAKKYPLKIHSDEGKEFFNREVKNLLKSKGIELYMTISEDKATIVERFDRTLKERMWRYFTYTEKFRYIDILPNLIKTYNNSYHRSIKMEPNKVNKSNSKQIYLNLYGFNEDRNVNIFKKKLFVGDHVRISKYKSVFDKGYVPNWTNEIFVINKILFKTRVVYKLLSLTNEVIDGIFYEEELQKVDINSNETSKMKRKYKKKQK